MDNLYRLDRIHPSHRPIVGNKAFNLSQLLQGGYPVVPGFVVPAIAFWDVIERLGKSEPLLADLPHSSLHIDVDNPRQLQSVAQEIRHTITTLTLPPQLLSALSTVAESLQAPALILHPSLALPVKQINKLPVERLQSPMNLQLAAPSDLEPSGILESYTCLSQPDALAMALKRVWAELFRARSLFYWQRYGIGLQQLNLAVLVQPLWDAIASGTLQANPTEWNIEAAWGMGIALTKEEVLPDSYQLQAKTGIVKAQQLGSKTKTYRSSQQQQSSALGESGLQSYISSEEQQQQYALDEKYLKQLIELSQRFSSEISSAFSLEWAVCQRPDISEPQLYLTQLTLQPSRKLQVVQESQLTGSTQPSTFPAHITPQLVRGLPAARGQVTGSAHVIIGENPNLETIIPGQILIARIVAPHWLPSLKQAAGIVTERGGMTSHAAIIARELGIPAVVGATNITQVIQTGELLLVDGNQGEIHRLGIMESRRTQESSAGREQMQEPQGESSQRGNVNQQSSSTFPVSPVLNFPIATQLLVNLSQPNSLEQIVDLPVDGVGLLRSELMMLDALENLHPKEWLRRGRGDELAKRLAQLILQFATAFAPRPVFYRSADWRSHEFQFLSGDTLPLEPEINPIIGQRGTRCYLTDPDCFDLELKALGEVYSFGYTNVQLMLPFVRDVAEFMFCRRRVEQAGLTDNPHFQLWIMAEVPSIVFLLPDYIKAGVQGISIGTNDLTQLLLAVDRDQDQLGSTLDGRHPAVKRAIKQLIRMAREEGIPCSICGQAPAQYPELIDLLVQWGITSISVDANDIEPTYKAIARAEQRLLLEAARQKFE